MRFFVCCVLQLLVLDALVLAQSTPSSSSVSSAKDPRGSSSQSLASEQFSARLRTGNIKSPSPPMGALNFAPIVDYGSGGYGPESVAVADVNGDGKPDLIAANYCGASSTCAPSLGTVAVLLGNGNGTFKTAVTYGSGGYSATSVAIADVNGDGKPDLIVANRSADSSGSADGSVSVLLGNGNGTFQSAVTYDSGGLAPFGVAVADVNGDGKPDLLVINSSCNSNSNCSSIGGETDGAVGVLLNNGNGTFQTAVAYDSGGIFAMAIAVGDVNGDGNPDVVLAQCSSNSEEICFGGSAAGVMLGNGNGTFQPAVNYSGVDNDPLAVALADVNGDGNLDILMTNPSSEDHGQADGNVAVFLGNGNGTFQAVVTYDAGGLAAGLAIADLTGDGKLDAVVIESPSEQSSSGTINAAVLAGNGDGTFQPAVLFNVGAGAASVAAGVLTESGLPDLVVGRGTSSSSVGVLINTSTTAVLSPNSLSFASQAPGTSSSPQTVTLTNIATATLLLSGISLTGPNAGGFAQTNNCPSSLATNASCQIKVTMDPQTAGGELATLQVADNLPSSPQTVALSGTGQDFSIAISPGTLTVTSGQAGNYNLVVSPLYGFAQTVNLTCSANAPQSSCTVTPASVALNGSKNATATLAVVTAGSSARLMHPYGRPAEDNRLAMWLAFSALPGLLLTGKTRWHCKSSVWLRCLLLIVLLALIITWSGCGGGGSGSSTPTGSYTVSLTGTYTSGGVTLSHTVRTTLIVQ